MKQAIYSPLPSGADCVCLQNISFIGIHVKLAFHQVRSIINKRTKNKLQLIELDKQNIGMCVYIYIIIFPCKTGSSKAVVQ